MPLWAASWLALVAAVPQSDESVDVSALAAALRAHAAAQSEGEAVERARGELAQALSDLRSDLDDEPLQRPELLARALWLSHSYAAAKTRAGKVSEDSFGRGSFDGRELAFAYRLPDEYDPQARSYPLILSIPDEDEDPAHHLRAHWTHPALLEGAVLVCPQMPDDRASWTRVVQDGRPGGLSHVWTALRACGERFAIDPDRVYVAGRGASVGAALGAGNAIPHAFAGVIARAGDASELAPDNFRNLPTYFANGGARASAFAEATREADFDNCTVDVDGTEEDVWSWIGSHPRRSYPERVTLVAGKPFPTRAYWLRIHPSAPDAHADATIDREANTVRIESAGVSHVTLYLNDALLDLGRPVKVLCNGAQQEQLIPRSPPVMLERIADGTSDSACVYVAESFHDATAPDAPAPGSDRAYAARLGERLEQADTVASLWELYRECVADNQPHEGERALRRIVRREPDHAEARAALGHVEAAGQWFSSLDAARRYEHSQDEAAARARGWVRHKSIWMHPEERGHASQGWVKAPESGLWLTLEDQKRLAQGWARQDLHWIAPDEAERVDDGLWSVAGEWLPLSQANRRRARIESMWRIPTADVLLHTTTDRDVGLRALEEMRHALADLRKVFGVEPQLPLRVGLLRDEEQYDRFAFGEPDGRRPATHAGRLHVIHSAFFAESWYPLVDGAREFAGMGVGYWDALAPYGDAYGRHSARLAVGLSYADAVDPSPKAVRRARTKGAGGDYYDAYGAEKKLPTWLRLGAAVYAERFFHDGTAPEDGDPWWARAWSLDNLAQRGGLGELDAVFACELAPDERAQSQKLMIEVGLVVAFLVDGDCGPVVEAHRGPPARPRERTRFGQPRPDAAGGHRRERGRPARIRRGVNPWTPRVRRNTRPRRSRSSRSRLNPAPTTER